MAGEAGGIGRAQPDAKTLEREPHGADDIHALAHQIVTQLDLKEIALHFLTAVLHGMKQRLIGAGDPCQHLRVPAVRLSVVLVNCAYLAGIRDEHPVAEGLEPAAGPGAVHADFHHDKRPGMATTQRVEALAAVGDQLFLLDFPTAVQNADGVLAIAEIDSDGGAGLSFHGSDDVITRGGPAPLLPSHLFLFGIGGYHPSHEFAWSSWSSRAWRCEKTA